MNATPLAQRVKTGAAAILLFILVVLCALAAPILMIAPWWVAAGIVATALLLALPIFLARRWFARAKPGWSPALSYGSAAVVLFMLLSAIVAFPMYWLAYIVDSKPSTMPLVTLTDGKKTLQFQGMQHIGSEEFYKSVVYDLREALDNGYRLYYEGVQPVEGRPDLTRWLDSLATGSDADLSVTYKLMADVCGLQFQLDYFKGLTKDMNVHPDHHVKADVTYLDMWNEYERLMRSDPEFAKEMNSKSGKTAKDTAENAALLKRVLSVWQSSNADQRKLMGLACRGYFSWSFSQPSPTGQTDKLIVDFRNRFLARMIADAKEDKMWVTYGAHHAPGVIAELQKIDPKWRVVSIKWSRVISNPDEWTGHLR